jgi:hypothetical protein
LVLRNCRSPVRQRVKSCLQLPSQASETASTFSPETREATPHAEHPRTRVLQWPRHLRPGIRA